MSLPAVFTYIRIEYGCAVVAPWFSLTEQLGEKMYFPLHDKDAMEALYAFMVLNPQWPLYDTDSYAAYTLLTDAFDSLFTTMEY
jgi:hypothetical protein